MWNPRLYVGLNNLDWRIAVQHFIHHIARPAGRPSYDWNRPWGFDLFRGYLFPPFSFISTSAQKPTGSSSRKEASGQQTEC